MSHLFQKNAKGHTIVPGFLAVKFMCPGCSLVMVHTMPLPTAIVCKACAVEFEVRQAGEGVD